MNTDEWLEAHRTAHRVGLRSNITIMHGTVERPVHVARHLVRTRDLQKETGGFTEFVPLPFVHMATPIFIQGKARRGPTFREVLLDARGRSHRVPRLDRQHPGVVGEVRSVAAPGRSSRPGANDLGGTLMDENISRAAGASHGQELDEAEFRAIVEPIGRTLAQRTTLYGRTQTVGRRLRPPDDATRCDGDGGADAYRAGPHPRPDHRLSGASPPLHGIWESRMSQFDVLGIGNALVDVLSNETDDLRRAACDLEPRCDDAHRRGPRPRAVRRDGPGGRDLRRLGGEHDGRARRPSAARPRTSARCATTSSVTCSPTTSVRPASPSGRLPRPTDRARVAASSSSRPTRSAR